MGCERYGGREISATPASTPHNRIERLIEMGETKPTKVSHNSETDVMWISNPVPADILSVRTVVRDGWYNMPTDLAWLLLVILPERHRPRLCARKQRCSPVVLQ